MDNLWKLRKTIIVDLTISMLIFQNYNFVSKTIILNKIYFSEENTNDLKKNILLNNFGLLENDLSIDSSNMVWLYYYNIQNII